MIQLQNLKENTFSDRVFSTVNKYCLLLHPVIANSTLKAEGVILFVHSVSETYFSSF